MTAMTAAAPSTTVNHLRARGLRISEPRRRLLAALADASEPRTAHELAAGDDLASVYRNLDAFHRAGVVALVDSPGGPRRYLLFKAALG